MLLLACILPIAAILAQVFLATHPFIAHVSIQASQIADIAHVYQLPPVTTKQSQIVVTTGHKHIPATQGHGTIVFYNGLTSPQVIEAGTLLVGRDGEEIVTDETAYTPAGNLSSNGSVNVPAHAVNPGVEGNIQSGDIYGPCCRQFIQAVNSQFKGGHSARDYQLVTKSDISNATADLLANLKINFKISPDETLLTPVPCSSKTTSNHKPGDISSQVVVSVVQICHPSAYRLSDIQRRIVAIVAGKMRQDALQQLAALPGVTHVGIGWGDDMRLPPARDIVIDIFVPEGNT
jgi:hypothetical protein